MGRYNDHRGGRRRGSDDDGATSYGDAEPSYFQRAPALSTAPAVDAEVLWFNAVKGFGFVKAADGSEAFLHIRALEAAGSTGVPEGARLKVRIEEGQKGRQVAEVVEIAAGTALPAATGRSAGALSRGPDAREEESHGSVKWYNSEKGFGFIGLDDGKKDVFVHATALTRSGLTTLAEGQKVVVLYVPGQKGLEARTIRPA